MFIENNILITWGAVSKKYKKGEYVFFEGEHAKFYYQIITGKIKLSNTNPEGKEFIHGEFKDGCSFGEPTLFINESYPANAIAMEDSIITKINKESFFEIISEFPVYQMKFITLLSQRIYDQTISTKEIINNSPEKRILAFLTMYKIKNAISDKEIIIPYTRQEIANYTGLRVETIIRTLSKMQTKNLVKIVNRKLMY